MRRFVPTWSAALLATLGLLACASSAKAGWGFGHNHARHSRCDRCFDRVGTWPTDDHWADSYLHGHRVVRFWGGPNHPLPALSGTPGFWDQPGWFNPPPAPRATSNGSAKPPAAPVGQTNGQ